MFSVEQMLLSILSFFDLVFNSNVIYTSLQK